MRLHLSTVFQTFQNSVLRGTVSQEVRVDVIFVVIDINITSVIYDDGMTSSAWPVTVRLMQQCNSHLRILVLSNYRKSLLKAEL